MASNFSADLKLELMTTGENAGTWGDKTNTNLQLIQQAVAGFEQVTLSSGGTLALVMSNAALSNARNMVIKFATASIAASTVCTIPDSIEKFYIFDCTGLTNPTNLTIKTASGTGFSPDRAAIFAAYSDGTNLKEISLDTLGGTIQAAQVGANAILTANISNANVTTAKIADDAVTFAKFQHSTAANRVIGAATAGAFGEVQVATDMIADDAVNADKLANTTVTAGTYTLATLTVDAQGRLTAASSGAVSAGSFWPSDSFGTAARGDHGGGTDSGNFTADTNTSKLAILAIGGGPGSAPGYRNHHTGQIGGWGYIVTNTISHPYTAAYAIGTAGTSTGPTGNPGNATTWNTNEIVANGATGSGPFITRDSGTVATNIGTIVSDLRLFQPYYRGPAPSDASYMFPKAPLISSQAKNLGAESAAGGIQVWEQKTGS